MIKTIIQIGLLVVSLGLGNYAVAVEKVVPVVPPDQVQALATGVPEIAANSFLLVDYESGSELAAYNASLRVDPASITKLMTAYVLYRELAKGTVKLDDQVLVNQSAWEMDGSRMFIEVGKKVELEKLMRGLIIQSGNDAAKAIADHIAGSEGAYVERMNQVAAELGMKDTHYSNVTGWPAENHYTTARDITILAKAIITEFPERYKLYSEKEFTYNKIRQYNRNKLLFRDPTVDGMKTGFTDKAGYCLVASAKRGDMRLISIMLGTASEEARAENSQKLLEYGFRTFETHKRYNANAVLHEARIWKGETETVPAGSMEDVYVSVQKGNYNNVKGTVQVNQDVYAPVKRGDVVGQIIFSDQGKIIQQLPLVALADVPEGGLWRQMVDSVKSWFN
ncbi:D-alanyl-D-alanine carboxypeptidase family protein [Thiofilum flexile]|uniref:D-alanyl-D-alanine carboxypeptidase family protein n=1 Tax=Thiofilum flexile TaxID=125627 RepID=UPI00037D0659|nr:D-alanyl-D-alanine carboxypeptidase family protein [Thiofilum flexile]